MTGSTKLVRLAALQYKIWQNKTLYIDRRMNQQLERLEKTFCEKHICSEGEDNRRSGSYRLPFCAAFLRPSDGLQSEDSSLISSGYYVPACVVKKHKKPTSKGGRLHSENIRSEAVTHKIFEEMFNIGMIGSRWLTFTELENMYRSNNILEPDERIIIHAQEIPFQKRASN